MKTYLNVPFTQKDSAKALGAKWDAIQRKWYVPADKDLALFVQWQTESITSATTSAMPAGERSTAPPDNINTSTKQSRHGAITQPVNKNFVAYDRDEPPWD
ncbi:MAG: hypothetical protein HOP23_17340 [Methylococcaceae bacterium]|nr:hypothetical protein [Methylococcaceae bacterium]